MDIIYHSKNYHTSDKLKEIAKRKVDRLDKYFADAECVVVCTKVGNVERMEITIVSGGHSFRAQEESRSMYGNIDVVLKKIERQIITNRDKLRSVIRKEAIERKETAFVRPAFINKAVTDVEVKKNKSFAIKVLSDKDAEVSLSTLDHNFFVYADETSNAVKVMYKRDDGHVGVIEITNATISKK